MSKPTVPQATKYQQIFDYFNSELFDGELKDCMLIFSRNANVIGGYFSPDRWYSEDDQKKVHEIAVNVNLLNQSGYMEIMNVIIHEMLHLQQWLDGTSGRNGYHNKEFMRRADNLGLDVQGGGDKVQTSIRIGGKAEKAALDMPDDFIFDYMAAPLHVDGEGGGEGGGKGGGEGDNQPESIKGPKGGKRTRYQCPICGAKVWGKGGLMVICGTDDRLMVAD